MKLLDKLLKKLNTDRNTFFTYLLTLITIYILIDRLTEFLLIVFTGVASSYWGPIKYTVAFAFPVFAFLFSMSSKFIKSDDDKHGWFYSYCISLYIYLIKPALSSIAIALPLCTWFKLFDKLYKTVNDSKVFTDSLADYEGINLSDKKVGWGPYTNEILIGTDKDHGNNVKLAEIRRFESTLVVGISGAGKTSMIFEPWVCQDINKKFFYRETSKTLAFAALKAGIATLNAPYDNDYINSNFSLNMLIPVDSKTKLFKAYFNKMILAETSSKTIFRDLGITYMSPDYETIDKISKVCDNFGFNYNIIDPDNPNSIGLNPFSFDDPIQTALAISTVLKGFYTDKNPEQEIMYRENLSNQIIENLAILLKIEYPKLNNDKLPNINDMLVLLNNFELIEKMCKILENDPELSKKYENQINYFKRNFYHDSPNRDEMEKAVSIPASQLDTLLRYPGVKNILCNRSNNLNFDKVLENGEISLICTRRGDLGENAHKAFGLFFLLLMQFSVLRRPGTEKTRIPHFLYIDEFPDFICPATESIFTVYRKYRVATVISAQNLAQIKSKGENLGNTILANCANKLVFGNNTPEDNEWWSREIGEKKEWSVDHSGYNFAKDAYDDKGKVTYGNSLKYKEGKVQALKFKRCIYKIRNLSGKIENGTAKVDFMPSKYKEKQKIKLYDFEKFSGGITPKEEKRYSFDKFAKTNLSNQHFSDDNDGPIKLDDSDLTFNINNDDAIVYTFKKGKKN